MALSLVQPAKLKNRYLGTMYLNDSIILRFSVSFVEGIKVKTIDKMSALVLGSTQKQRPRRSNVHPSI